ncbi:MAG: hypothetical protein ACREKS_13345 [Candidatus Rokuibacteriota bacterium]
MVAGRNEHRPLVIAHLLALAIALGPASTSPAADAPGGLVGLRRVGVLVDLEHPIDPVSVEDLVARVEEAVRGAEPALAIHEAATDRVRLVVSVGPVSATTLRGFWLPLSGTYGIGSVRLAVERLVTVPGAPRPLAATVWQSERRVAGPWRTIGGETMQVVDELLAELLEARRQVR